MRFLRKVATAFGNWFRKEPATAVRVVLAALLTLKGLLLTLPSVTDIRDGLKLLWRDHSE